jgi:hypothetical protein
LRSVVVDANFNAARGGVLVGVGGRLFASRR